MTDWLTHDPKFDLVLEREVPVSPTKVWRAWTEPDRLMQWFTPAPWRTTACDIDLRPGGVFRTVMEGPAGERHDSSGCYLEVLPERRLVFTDALLPGFRPAPVAEGVCFTGVIELFPTAGGTRYRATAMHRDEAGRAAHDAMGFHHGWGAALDQLVAAFR